MLIKGDGWWGKTINILYQLPFIKIKGFCMVSLFQGAGLEEVHCISIIAIDVIYMLHVVNVLPIRS